MSRRSDILLLSDISDSITKIENYTNNLDLEEFKTNDLVLDAVARNFEIIGEAANRLSKELKDSHPDVLWKSVVGFRNRIVHEYFGVDSEIVWQIKQEYLPELKLKIEGLLNRDLN